MGLIVGIEHLGVTVPDVEQATKFFEDAFDAEIVYVGLEYGGPPVEGERIERFLNVPPGTKLRAQRLIRIANGPNLEVFQMDSLEQHAPVHPNDFGLQHFGVYTHDIYALTEKFKKAGGTLFGEPGQSTFSAEEAPDFHFCYGRTPWGQTIEMISYTHMPYEKTTALRRWRPSDDNANQESL